MRQITALKCVNRSSLVAVALLTLLLSLNGCEKNSSAAKSSHAAKSPSAHLVVSLVVQPEPISSRHLSTGTLKARRIVHIYNQEEGQITQVKGYEGDPVSNGDLLIEMDATLLRAQLDKASATAQQAKVDLNRIEKLVNRRAVSEDELARAKTQLDVARAEQRLLQTRIGYTRIQSPFDGIITDRRVEPGDVVARHSHLLTLIDPDSLVTEVHLSELLLPEIQKGDPVDVEIDALGSQSFPGRILRIHPELDRLTRQGTIEVLLDPVPTGARPGQFTRITLNSAGKKRLMVPFTALQHDKRSAFVYLIDPQQQAIRHEVRTGIRIADQVEIISGLNPGDEVITRGFLGLREKLPVKRVAKSDN